MQTWNDVVVRLSQEPGQVLLVPKNDIEHPEGWGMAELALCPVGHHNGWRGVLADCRSLHVLDAGENWSAHLDPTDPRCSELRHTLETHPAVSIAVGTGMGALSGLFFGKGVAKGAAFGALASGVSVIVAKLTRRK